MTILVLAPHADDETLGMGATISLHTKNGEDVYLAVLTGKGKGNHPFYDDSVWQIVRAECREASKNLGIKDVTFLNLPAANLDSLPAWEINAEVKNIVEDIQPTQIYLPFYNDLHKDHKSIAYAINVVCRPYLKSSKKLNKILAYETLSETNLSYEHSHFSPNIFVDVSETIDNKIKALSCYKSQLSYDYHPRSIGSIKALAALRGSHIGCAYAEAFVLLGEYIR
tara:strand:- start:214 stop:888 length:675 start_codon:yes stop_codon:yes gene_type:complete